MAREPELSIKVKVDPVIDRDKFQNDVNTLIPESKPIKINGEIDAAKALQSVSGYQKGGQHPVPVIAKISNAQAAINEAFNNETGTDINVRISAASKTIIQGQLQDIINGLDVSKISSAVPKSSTKKKTTTKTDGNPLPVSVTPDVTDESINTLRTKIQGGLTEIPITASIRPEQLASIHKSVTDALANISFDPTVKKVNGATQSSAAKKKINIPSEDRLSELMSNAQYAATKSESEKAAAAKQKDIIYQNLVDHQAKAAENANDATSKTAQGLSDANKSMGDLNAKAEEFGQNWRQVVTLIASATKNLAKLMVGQKYGDKWSDIFSSFEDFEKDLPVLDVSSKSGYLDPIEKWADSLLKAATGEFDSQTMEAAIHMMSGLADALSQVDINDLPTTYKNRNGKMVDVSKYKDKLISDVDTLRNIFPSSNNKEPFLGAKDASIQYLLDFLAKYVQYSEEVGTAAKQTADSIATANQGFANQAAELKQTNAELEKLKQNENSPISNIADSSAPSLPLPETPNYTKPSEILDDYRDSVGAAAGIQQYFASEVDNATVSLGKQTEQLIAAKKASDEYYTSLTNGSNPIDIKGKITIEDSDITVPDKITINGEVIVTDVNGQNGNNPGKKQKPNNNPPSPQPQPQNGGNNNPQPQPPVPPTPQPPNNQPPNNSGNNPPNNGTPSSQKKLEADLAKILNEIMKLENIQDAASDKNFQKNVNTQIKRKGQLWNRADEIEKDLDTYYPGWDTGKSWKRHTEDFLQTRNNFTSKRADKQDIDVVNQLQDAYDRLLKAKKDLYKIDSAREKARYDNKKREIDDTKDEISTLKTQAKNSGVHISNVRNQFLSKAKELREWIANQSIPTDEELFEQYERLTKQLETSGRRYSNSIGNGNVWDRINAQNEYGNIGNQLDQLETEFSNRGLRNTSSLEYAKTTELLNNRINKENAVATAVKNRIEAEQKSIEVGWQDAKNINSLTSQLESYKRTLEGTDNGLRSSAYGFVSGLSTQADSLFQSLDSNIGADKNQIAQSWASQNNITGINSLADAYEYLKNEVQKAQREVQKFNDTNSQSAATTQALIRISNLQSQLNDYLAKYPKVEKGLADSVKKLRDGLAAPDAAKNVKSLSEQMANLRANAKKAGLETENLLDKFENLFGQHLSTMITMAALHQMQNALGVIYRNVVSIDTAMTELRKVTNLTSEEYSKFMDRASAQAQKLGVSISDIINSTADWSRLGYSPKDAENLATYSTLLKNVGDGIDDVNTSSSYLISTLQGFGLLADDAEDIVNKIDAVANTQPVTANDLGEILTRSSAAMSAANNTLEETIALGTAANAVIQDADSVGTVLKTLSMYLRASKTDAEAAGIEVDGMADSVSKLRSELLSLTGVDVMADNKNFKSTYKIMKELSEVWGSLSDVTQANVTEMLAGKRNSNAVSAILNNFSVAESAMESAANSANVAWEENDQWLDSIEGRLSQLNASFQSLSVDTLKSDFVKDLVSLATAFVKCTDAVVKFTGAFPAASFFTLFIGQLGEPKMTGFMIVPSNTPGGNTEQVLRRYSIISMRSMREYLAKPTNMAA